MESWVKQYDDRWVAEMSIPFSTLRFKEGFDHWSVKFCRVDYGHKNYEARTPSGWIRGIGGDAKIGISSSLKLDLTVNPDFSQVDQQVTNLDRFEIYFPEKRQFFLENKDLFSEFGMNEPRPYFSRRIGFVYDENKDQYVENPILFGARLSGKLNQNWKVGLLDIQTAQDPGSGTTGTNFAVATVHRRVFERSTIATFLVNKDPIESFSGECDSCEFGTFNRVGGVDFKLASADNWWTGKVFYHHAFDEVPADNSFSHGAEFAYANGNLTARWVIPSIQNV